MLAAAKDIPHLTGLRAVAALMVLLLHLDEIHGNVLARHLAVVAQGYLGVDIFFVLSGYILSHVYSDTVPGISIKTYALFLWRRLARIYPVHVAALAALFVMVAARGLLNTNFWIVADIPRHLMLMQAWTDSLTWNLPAWSISAEWAAYVLFPLFAYLIFGRAPLWLGFVFVLGLLATFQLSYLHGRGLAGAFLGWPTLQRVMTEFTIGMLGYRLSRSTGPSWAFDVVAVISFTVMLTVPLPLVKIIAVGVFVPTVAMSQTVVRGVLSSNVVVAVGVVSYSIYMVHFPILKLVENFNYRFGLESTSPLVAPIQTVLWAAVTVAAAAITYRTIERPARDWCRRREQRFLVRRLHGAE
jgi:peptidoglycan/LPS O-acetylase OafA/YrhL